MSKAAAGSTSMRKVVTASLVGTSIEWYDFYLFGSAAALVFNRVFFPDLDPLLGTLLSFSTFATGFIARPIGGLVFGHLGDLIGRKKMLVASLIIMGVATFAIGLLPGYATAGLLAPLLLVVCRLAQGFAVGGEWGGAVLLAAEHGDPQRRGFWASWPQVGAPLGQVLSNGVLWVMALTTSDEAFLSWGWRVPFLLSAVLVVFGLWIRISLTETPVFRKAQQEVAARRTSRRRFPALDAFRRYPRQIVKAIGVHTCDNVAGYTFSAFMLVYVTESVGVDRQVGLLAVVLGSVVHAAVIPFWGRLSDRLGRRPLCMAGAAGVIVWAFVFFPLLNTASAAVIVLAVSIGFICHGAIYGPLAAFFAEMFDTEVRYSGASIAYQFGTALVGSTVPLVGVALLAATGSWVPVACYLALSGVVTLVATYFTDETVRRDLTAADAQPADGPARQRPASSASQ